MRNFSERRLLELWEGSERKSPLYFSLLIICEFYPELSFEKVLQLPIGVRDILIFKIRKELLGDEMTGYTSCPQCGEKVEWKMKYLDFGFPFEPGIPDKIYHSFQKGRYRITYRLPNSSDSFEMLKNRNNSDNYNYLISECIQEVILNKKAVQNAELPNDILEKVFEQMELKDEFANIRISVVCPACKNQWESIFDVVDYFWMEVNSLTNRILSEIGILAYSFGWSEKEILDLTPERRRTYIEMLNA